MRLLPNERFDLTKRGQEATLHPRPRSGLGLQVKRTTISGKAQCVNVTIPERILSLVDADALRSGKTCSGLIAEAAVEYIATQSARGS